MSKTLLILFLAILTVGCSQKSLSPIDEGSNIVAFGDSLTFGYGASPNESYPEKLKSKINRNIINEGVNGNTTEDGVSRINEVLETYSPSLIIIGLGGNDMLRKVDEETTKNNLRKLIDISKTSGAEVILLATPRPSIMAALGSLNDAEFYEDIAKEKEVPLIENVYSELLSKPQYKSDPIHLNAKGYDMVAENIAKFLKESGAIKD